MTDAKDQRIRDLEREVERLDAALNTMRMDRDSLKARIDGDIPFSGAEDAARFRHWLKWRWTWSHSVSDTDIRALIDAHRAKDPQQ
jgi:hypothetical protein